MMNLAQLADAYNPTLLLISFSIGLYFAIKQKSYQIVLLLLSAVIVYGILFIDKRFMIWHSFGLDYSTHTATALAMSLFIGVTVINFILRIVLAVTLVAYCSLMVHLSYHSWADITSTGIAVGVLLLLLYWLVKIKNFVAVKVK